MAKEGNEEDPSTLVNNFQKEDEDKDFDLGSEEPETPFPISVTSRVLFMLSDIAAGPAYRFSHWLELVRKRSGRNRSSGFPRRSVTLDAITFSAGDYISDGIISPPSEQGDEISLWERLGKASKLSIEPNSFSWDSLSSLHHTEHSNISEQSEDETNRALEVTVNSGGVVFFALFNQQQMHDHYSTKEAAAVIKFSSSRMATQSERLGYEFAKWLGVQTPNVRVIHNSCPEWLKIKEATEKARDQAVSEGDEVGELTCSELLEALELSRCLLLMNYVHGCPLLESSSSFDSQEAAQKTAVALGRILMLDLVIRNEDRLPCHQLGWRGNSANLLLSDEISSANIGLKETLDSSIERHIQKDRRASSMHIRLTTETPKSTIESSFGIVAIDSGVPRRPPAGKRVSDQETYPELVELLINSRGYASSLLYEVTNGKLGSPLEDSSSVIDKDKALIVQEFRSGFRAALRELQGFQMFLLALHQKLDILLRAFFNITSKISSGESSEKDESVNLDQAFKDDPSDSSIYDFDRTPSRASSSACKGNLDSSSPMSREGKFGKWSGESFRNLRLTSKIRDFHKFAKVDVELNKELEQWNEMLKNDALKLCMEHNFNSGFFEGGDSYNVADAYELKVRLEHILERITLISEAANTEKPSQISNSLFIGGALAASSFCTLKHFGISHILCLCSNEIGQSDSQRPELFEYRNISIRDEEDANISSIFSEAHDFIDHVEQTGGKILVHCFEGKSRSATVVIAYLMIRKKMTLSEAWNSVKRVHRRAQPNDGFARILLELDQELHGKVSMEWQRRKPTMKAPNLQTH
ncbi:dual specificity protein phosphatase PHS1-like isoform X2 [Impatiens glandulifera]|uniref:dual specificity protein phosphatase PHS1-like isoform X2 n=1 Tax=Impatiens glandulifera TaxID=253017 RepID=UPI001FB10941|nr:dual specificity protein phosphatase PHS1-like isoform X2 [Impatiens glandulifera]